MFSEVRPIQFGLTPTPYEICQERWLDAELDVYDLALFARQAYELEPNVIKFLAHGYPV